MKEIIKNNIHKQTHSLFLKLKIFLGFYRNLLLCMLLTRRKILNAFYLEQPLSDTILVYLMLYMRACKQREDPAEQCFQKCQDSTARLI